MYKIFWILVFCSFSVTYLNAQEAQNKKQDVPYDFIVQMTRQGKLHAVLLAKDKAEANNGKQIELKDVEFYFPSPQIADDMVKVTFKDLSNFSAKNSPQVRVWKGDKMLIDINRTVGGRQKFEMKDLSSFAFKGKAQLQFDYGFNRKTLVGQDFTFKDNTLTIPSKFSLISESYSLTGAKASFKMKAGELDVNKDDKEKSDKSKAEFKNKLINQFEELRITAPITIDTYLPFKEDPEEVKKREAQMKKESEETKAQGKELPKKDLTKEKKKKKMKPSPVTMTLKKDLVGKITAGNNFSFVSKGSMEGVLKAETRDVFVTGDSVQAVVSHDEKSPGLRFLEIEQPWVKVKEFKDAIKKEQNFIMNMAGRQFRWFPDYFEMTGQPISIWNKEMMGTVSHLSFKTPKSNAQGAFKFKNPDINVDPNGWKKMQKQMKEKRKK